MIGCYDFCGHYEWTFEWLQRLGGESLVQEYWAEAIGSDAQRHAAELIKGKGFQGMVEYWTHTLAEEAAGYVGTSEKDLFRLDMHECPSKGFLLRNGLQQFHDYCDHCIGWIGPIMEEAGFQVNHEHNHCGQCWWEFRLKDDPSGTADPGRVAGNQDVRLRGDWANGPEIDVFRNVASALGKTKPSRSPGPKSGKGKI